MPKNFKFLQRQLYRLCASTIDRPQGRSTCTGQTGRPPDQKTHMTKRLSWLLALALVLAGCSGMRVVDSNVNAFSSAQGVTVPASYRFERLPSQQARDGRRQWLEMVVQKELDKVGMGLDLSAPRYSVTVDVRMARDPRAPWDDPLRWGGFHGPVVVMTPRGAVFHYPSFGLEFSSPYYRREVSLLMRRLSDGVLVYETRASHDGRWSDDEAVLPAMFEAALRDFPNPPAGTRRVDIEIAR